MTFLMLPRCESRAFFAYSLENNEVQLQRNAYIKRVLVSCGFNSRLLLRYAVCLFCAGKNVGRCSPSEVYVCVWLWAFLNPLLFSSVLSLLL
jgi:hypothetical protein